MKLIGGQTAGSWSPQRPSRPSSRCSRQTGPARRSRHRGTSCSPPTGSASCTRRRSAARSTRTCPAGRTARRPTAWTRGICCCWWWWRKRSRAAAGGCWRVAWRARRRGGSRRRRRLGRGLRGALLCGYVPRLGRVGRWFLVKRFVSLSAVVVVIGFLDAVRVRGWENGCRSSSFWRQSRVALFIHRTSLLDGLMG